MTDSQLPETTECGSRGNVGRYNSETLPPAEHVSFNQEQVGKRFGWVIIMSASEGETREQIIAEAELAVVEKRKSWRTIQQRLESMTYSMPDHVTVSPRTTS